MKKVILGCTIAFGLSGCFAMPWDDGKMMLIGDAEGIRSFYDGNNGLVANAKTTDPTGDSAHWRHRAHQESELTRRRCVNCSFLGKLFGGGRSEAKPENGS